MAVHTTQSITFLLPNMTSGYDSNSQVFGKLPITSNIVAQHITDPDVLGDMQRIYNNFVDSGQVWALLSGLVIGYMIRSLTSYG